MMEQEYVQQRAIDVLGGEYEAQEWMALPHPELGGRVPGDVLKNGDAERVQAILERIALGLPA